MGTTTALDLVNATLATVNASLEHTSYSATAHRSKEGVIVVENSTMDLDDEAAGVAQEESDRAMTAALEAVGFTMIDAGGCGGGESACWSTWRGLVSWEIVSAEPNGHVGERILFSTKERAEEALERLAESLDCDESELRIVERAEAPDAGF